ncbi:unnamed protein product [Gulo gulo]|uniref:N-terminal Ras-GEF domain-containing protein n=1 Tax=Gulo gulo TaxID=48420 RepID=A0A9X9Q703_GULGU|nr:unnamed protein product [Gulo gulo]
MLWTNQANSLETQIQHLLPTLLGRDLSYIYMFLGAYKAFATTQDVLDLLFAKEFWTTEKKLKTKTITSCLQGEHPAPNCPVGFGLGVRRTGGDRYALEEGTGWTTLSKPPYSAVGLRGVSVLRFLSPLV